MSLEPHPRRATSSHRSCASVQINCHFKKDAFLLLTKLSVQPNPLSTSMWLLGPPVPCYFHDIPEITAHYRPLRALQLKSRNSLLPAKWRLLKIYMPLESQPRRASASHVSCASVQIKCYIKEKASPPVATLSVRHHLSDMSPIF